MIGPKPVYKHCHVETHDCVRDPVVDVITRHDGRTYATPACAYHLERWALPKLIAGDPTIVALRNLAERAA